mgnify:CR=1 FL=1
MTPPRLQAAEATLTGCEPAAPLAPLIPRYLEQVYWWAYVHPNAVTVFEREWLVSAILFGHYWQVARRGAGRAGRYGARQHAAGGLRLRQPHAEAARAPGARRAPGRRGHPADPVEEPRQEAAARPAG